MKLWHLYAVIGVVGLVLTGSQALGYVSAGPIGGTVEFWRDAFTGNDASRFLAVDILTLVTGLFVFLWVEGHRLGIAARWRVAYILGSTLIASAAFIPFFLAHRQRVLEG